ncbi:hypothetical protein D3C85_1249920 [compost metagenome]
MLRATPMRAQISLRSRAPSATACTTARPRISVCVPAGAAESGSRMDGWSEVREEAVMKMKQGRQEEAQAYPAPQAGMRGTSGVSRADPAKIRQLGAPLNSLYMGFNSIF